MNQRTRVICRRTTGRRKSYVRIGPLPALVFVALCLFTAVVGMMIERAVTAYESALQHTGEGR
jgi:hypothetical protein